MLTFSERNITWLKHSLSYNKDKITDKAKLEEVEKLILKLDFLQSKVTLDIQLDLSIISQIEETIATLEDITATYTSMTDITVLDEYDFIKKQYTGQLQFLSTYKDMFLDEANRLEDTLKKEIRVNLVEDIMTTNSISFSQADKLVEKDKRYTLLKMDVFKIRKVANKIKTKYDFYSKVWQMVFQSISTASKEKYMSKNNNDT